MKEKTPTEEFFRYSSFQKKWSINDSGEIKQRGSKDPCLQKYTFFFGIFYYGENDATIGVF